MPFKHAAADTLAIDLRDGRADFWHSDFSLLANDPKVTILDNMVALHAGRDTV